MTSIPASSSGRGVIFTSYLMAFTLTVMPMPEWLKFLRPEWVALVTIYWAITLPDRVGVGFAWSMGLLLDVLRDALLGQHALGLAVAGYLALKLHQRFRLYPLWQQAFSILVLVTLYQLLVLWVNGVIGRPAQSWGYWLPSIASMLAWPLVFTALRELTRYFRVS